MNEQIAVTSGTLLSAAMAIKLVWSWLDKAKAAIQKNPNPEFEKKLSEYCNNPHLKIVDIAASGLQKTFANSFGNKFNLRFFVTSGAFSMLTVVTMTLLWSLIRPTQYASFLEVGLASSLVALLLAAILLNLVPDVLSLWQTSKIVEKLENYQQKTTSRSSFALAVVIGFAIDVVVTLAIAIFVLFLYSIFHQLSFSELTMSAIGLEAVATDSFSVGIFFYTTFATTVWVGLWALASSLQLSERIWSRLVSVSSSVIDSKKDPFTPIFWSIKLILAIFFLSLFWINGGTWGELLLNLFEAIEEIVKG